jgi:hypothetical protein
MMHGGNKFITASGNGYFPTDESVRSGVTAAVVAVAAGQKLIITNSTVVQYQLLANLHTTVPVSCKREMITGIGR